jgi:hypothetical protein
VLIHCTYTVRTFKRSMVYKKVRTLAPLTRCPLVDDILRAAKSDLVSQSAIWEFLTWECGVHGVWAVNTAPIHCMMYTVCCVLNVASEHLNGISYRIKMLYSTGKSRYSTVLHCTCGRGEYLVYICTLRASPSIIAPGQTISHYSQ